MSPDDVRDLARSAPSRWTTLELVHRCGATELHARLRHGELDAVDRRDGRRIRERGAPPSSFLLRDLEPYPDNYRWSAMLDPYELGAGVAITDVRTEVFADRPVVAFTARAEDGYDPVCSCCPLLLSEVSERLEHGPSWQAPAPGELPERTELALDLGTGIVVRSRDLGGRRGDAWTTEILAAG